MCVCVSVFERERERQRDRDRQRDALRVYKVSIVLVAVNESEFSIKQKHRFFYNNRNTYAIFAEVCTTGVNTGSYPSTAQASNSVKPPP